MLRPVSRDQKTGVRGRCAVEGRDGSCLRADVPQTQLRFLMTPKINHIGSFPAIAVLFFIGLQGCKDSDRKINTLQVSDIELRTRNSLSDDALNLLIKQHVTENQLKEMYGNNPTITEGADLRILHFNLAIQHPFMRNTPGRVGFSAVFRNGRFVEWHEIYMGA